MGDIHNDNQKFEKMLNLISLTPSDHLFILGDLFDRCNSHPEPVEVYFNVLKLTDKVSIIKGNHDLWLAEYINNYYSIPEKKRKKLTPYGYNSFELMKARLTEVDMLQLASFLNSFAYQLEIEVEGKKYLMAHAMTSNPQIEHPLEFYTMGIEDSDYYLNGIPGYISLCGHTDSSFMKGYGGTYSDEKEPSIWRNEMGNLIMIDCGCGFSSGRLACICLETGKEFYV